MMWSTSKKNDNTDRYEVESRLMLRKNLFHRGELTYPVISAAPHPIDDAALFEINCAAGLETDARVILTADALCCQRQSAQRAALPKRDI